MGYDMYWDRQPPPDSPQMVEWAAREVAFNDYVKSVSSHRTEAEQTEVMRLAEAAEKAQVFYFRLNIWGMSTARDELVSVGIATADYLGPPPWPEQADDPDDPGYHERVDAWLSWVPPDHQTGIAIHKLCDNSGWHVTPGEITSGLAWADHYHPDWRTRVTDYVAEFATWMERAAREGNGFRVH